MRINVLKCKISYLIMMYQTLGDTKYTAKGKKAQPIAQPIAQPSLTHQMGWVSWGYSTSHT